MLHAHIISDAINGSPLNCGLRGEDWVANGQNISVVDGRDVTLFDFESPGVYQVHVLFDEARGRAAIEKVKAAFRHIFESCAEVVFGMVPSFRRDVAWLARQTGMKFSGTRMTDCGPCDLYVLPATIWKRSVQWAS
jgi:hypothetical protein